MKRNILLQFGDEDDYADVLVAIRALRKGESTKEPAERGYAIAAICRLYSRPLPVNASKPTNGAPLPGQRTLPILNDD